MNAISAVTSAMAGSASSGIASGPAMGAASSAGAAATPFGSLFTDAVGTVDSLNQQAGAAVQGLMTGTGVDVHQTMIATQKASMSFELALSVRNKAVQAYQSVMGMQF